MQLTEAVAYHTGQQNLLVHKHTYKLDSSSRGHSSPAMDSPDWEAQLHECLAQSSIMQEGCFHCWLDGAELARLTAEAADVLQEEGSRGRRLSCVAAVHLPLPEAGITLQACNTLSRPCAHAYQIATVQVPGEQA